MVIRTTEQDKKVATRIKIIREMRGIPRKVIAGKIGITYSTYGKIEKGKMPISAGTVEIISQELRVPMIAFYDDEIYKNILSSIGII